MQLEPRDRYRDRERERSERSEIARDSKRWRESASE